jgi:hypothetical protein
MRPITSKHIVWYLRRSLERLGLLGVAGLGIFAFCGMYFVSTLMAEQKEVKLLQRELDALQASHAANKNEPQQGDQLKIFYESFPNINTAPDALARIHKEALVNGVVLDQGEYSLVRNEGDRMVRYGVILPIKGDYIHIRKFLSQTLADMHYVSLDSVEFQRQKISDTTLDAQVKMTFFLVDN